MKKILLKKKISDLTSSFIFTFCREYISPSLFENGNISNRFSNFLVKKLDRMGKIRFFPRKKKNSIPTTEDFQVIDQEKKKDRLSNQISGTIMGKERERKEKRVRKKG